MARQIAKYKLFGFHIDEIVRLVDSDSLRFLPNRKPINGGAIIARLAQITSSPNSINNSELMSIFSSTTQIQGYVVDDKVDPDTRDSLVIDTTQMDDVPREKLNALIDSMLEQEVRTRLRSCKVEFEVICNIINVFGAKRLPLHRIKRAFDTAMAERMPVDDLLTYWPKVLHQAVVYKVESAMADNILTHEEKQEIISQANVLGVGEQELQSIIHDGIQQVVARLPKEDTTNCPCCGAQTPLISRNCVFCGQSILSTSDGAALGIVSQCPDCGAQRPMLSNVCPSCGHIYQADVLSEFNIRHIIAEMRQHSGDTSDVIVSLKWLAVLKLPAYMFVVCAALWGLFMIYDNALYEVLSICIGLAAFIWTATRHHIDYAYPMRRADDTFFRKVSVFEKYSRLVDTFYGDNAEARAAVDEYRARIGEMASRVRSNRIVCYTALIVPMLASAALIVWLSGFIKG